MAKKVTEQHIYQAEIDERMVPEKHKGSGIYGEHIARYSAVEELVRGKSVLDIASGSGYGTFQLAKFAKSIVGVDVSEDAILYSRKHYASNNIVYVKGDGKRIPADDHVFDVVVCFETIEHLDDYHVFMAEINRVLKPDGLLVLSTPNDKEFAEGNHFHLHEFENDELLALVRQYYKYVKPYYQATWIGNIIGTYENMTAEWESKVLFRQLKAIDPDKFLYFYFLCSNREITESIETQVSMSQHWSDRSIVEKNQLTADHIRNLENIIVNLRADAHTYKKEYKNITNELQSVYASKRWRIVSRIVNTVRRKNV